MDNDFAKEQQVPTGVLNGVTFNVLAGTDTEKICTVTVGSTGEVTDPRLGIPNSSNQCTTCGATNYKQCEGHFGVINFPHTIVHPYFLSEVAKILNKICPGCKSIRKKLQSKKTKLDLRLHEPKGCKYCLGSMGDRYPAVKFKVSSKDLSRRTVIVVEVAERISSRNGSSLPSDFWDFLPVDEQHDEAGLKPNRRILSHSQGIDPTFVKKYAPNTSAMFMNCFPITPNCHRVTESVRAGLQGQRFNFDNRTRAYKKLVDFRGTPVELGSRVLDCLKISKLNPDKLSNTESAFARQRASKRDLDFVSSGLRWMKDVVLGKRSDDCFRMVVAGDPNLRINEVGIPCQIAERLQVSENLNSWNSQRLIAFCDLLLLQKGQIYVRRKGSLVPVQRKKELQFGDTIYRPLSDGDMVLINRPPTIHQHSHIALSVRVLPVTSVLAINPLCCSPLRGDFDGDCLHGYVPQAVEANVELKELVALEKQLINEQSGRNLLSLSQDSLIAAHLIVEDGIFLNKFQMQQLEMWCPRKLIPPAIVKVPSHDGSAWTGKQLFTALLPPGFDWNSPSSGICIQNGEVICVEGSFWLREANENVLQMLIKNFPDRVLNFLQDAQVALSEWLFTRGFSVSLSDLYLSSDAHTRKNLTEEISYGLLEAYETCNVRQLMVESSGDFLAGNCDVNEDFWGYDTEWLSYERQKSAPQSQASVDAFKRVFRDIQNLAFRYASKENSMMSMFKGGSKGNLLKLVQHSMSIGLQHSLVPLSFNFPHRLSCSAWNRNKRVNVERMVQDSHFPQAFIPYAVVENSFFTGLNPLECFAHSVTNRACSFSENAEVPGTLHRKLMYFLRDVYLAYDGTVRCSYGNQLVEFSYNVDKSTCTSHLDGVSDRDGILSEGVGGQPVGSQSACALSEAAYSALDQPISILETSPLLNLKNVLECRSRKSSGEQIMTLYLSKKLRKIRYGFEYGALEVKDFLEAVYLSDIVSTSMIIFSPQANKKSLIPWVCHLYISKELARRRGLKASSIVDSLQRRCKSAVTDSKISLPCLEILTECSCSECSVADKKKKKSGTFCITVAIVETTKKASIPLKAIRETVIPFLLGTIVKGFKDIKRVDIFWNESNYHPKLTHSSPGELYLRVCMSVRSSKINVWNALMDNCVQIMDAVDWTRSHPDDIREFSSAYGIDSGWKYFVNCLASAVADTGKTVVPEHLLLVANCLSTTGEFLGLNAKGIARQREMASVSSPFMLGCFSNPGSAFIKAAKGGVKDYLKGSVDALAWGKIPSMGTGGLFDIIYSKKGYEISEPSDVYHLLSQGSPTKQYIKVGATARNPMSDKLGSIVSQNGATKALEKLDLDFISKSLRKFMTYNDIMRLSIQLKRILLNISESVIQKIYTMHSLTLENNRRYEIDERLGEKDKALLMRALYLHPRRDEKIGTGAAEIKVGYHSKFKNSRCFILERLDGSIEDFSYHKCVLSALEIVAPEKVRHYQAKWLKHGSD